ncbi:hypothetical protein Taro_009034 [Colocasia esculenta]|uniref:Uncharacterized protein n=1 Tax=Colocasia esculenta TaxID=4460 RepID=A0A843U4P8_COLES|nr:hypothetical protein [Colocasia esculenta]
MIRRVGVPWSELLYRVDGVQSFKFLTMPKQLSLGERGIALEEEMGATENQSIILAQLETDHQEDSIHDVIFEDSSSELVEFKLGGENKESHLDVGSEFDVTSFQVSNKEQMLQYIILGSRDWIYLLEFLLLLLVVAAGILGRLTRHRHGCVRIYLVEHPPAPQGEVVVKWRWRGVVDGGIGYYGCRHRGEWDAKG